MSGWPNSRPGTFVNISAYSPQTIAGIHKTKAVSSKLSEQLRCERLCSIHAQLRARM